MHFRSRNSIPVLSGLFLLFFAGIISPVHGEWTPVQPRIESSRNPAGGQLSTVVTIPALGRYSLQAKSGAGSRIEVADRMAGVLGQDGSFGGLEFREGRVDLFLEPGEYLIRAEGPAGHALEVKAIPFRMENAKGSLAGVPWMMEGESWDGELGDLAMRGWWVHSDGSRSLEMAMAGRALRGAALWKDGLWNQAQDPLATEYEILTDKPEAGMEAPVPRTFGFLEYGTVLPEGDYLLVTWGGEPRLRANGEKTMPAMVRREGDAEAAQGDRTLVMGPLGLVTFSLADGASLVEAEPLSDRPVGLDIQSRRTGRIRMGATPRTVSPGGNASRRVDLRCPSGKSFVTLRGTPGDSVRVRWTASSRLEAFRNRNDGRSVYVHFQSSLDADDRGAGGYLGINSWYDQQIRKNRWELAAEEVPVLPADGAWRQTVNALSANRYLVRPERAGTWTVLEKAGGASAEFVFQELDETLNGSDTKPRRLKSGQSLFLSAKPWILTVEPSTPGLLDFILAGGISALKGPALFNESRPVASVSWARSQVVTNPGKDVTRNFLVSSHGTLGSWSQLLPLDPAEAFPVDLPPGGSISLPLEVSRELILDLEGSPEGVRLDGKDARSGMLLGAGRHQMDFRAGTKGLSVQVSAHPRELSVAPASVPDPDAILAKLERVVPDRGRYQDFRPGEKTEFLLEIPDSGAWHAETQGRLSMEIAIRTRMVPRLLSASANARGRNALLDAWLRKGTYLVQVGSIGQGRGRGGITFTPAPVDGGEGLSDSTVSRNQAREGAFLGIPLRMEKTGQARIDFLSLGSRRPWRLEDRDGWPVGSARKDGNWAGELQAGDYRVVLDPGRTADRRLVTLRGEPEVLLPARSGDRVILPLGQGVRAVWKESPSRLPQTWTFEAPGNTRLVLETGRNMNITLTDPRGTLFRTIPAEESGHFEWEAAPGSWTLSVQSPEVDDLREYRLALTCPDLLAGNWMDMGDGSTGIVAQKAGFHEIWTLGTREWDLVLRDASGKRIATSSPLHNDWNVSILAWLEPGRYVLEARSAGDSTTRRVEYESRTGLPRIPGVSGNIPTVRYDAGTVESDDDNDGYGEDGGYYEEGEGDGGEYEGDGGYYEGDGEYDEYGSPADAVMIPVRSAAQLAAAKPVSWQDQVSLVPAALPHPLALSGTSRLYLDFRSDMTGPAVRVPGKMALSGGEGVQIRDIETGSDGILTVSVDPEAPVDIALVEDGVQTALGRGRLAVPLEGRKKRSLRIWTSANRSPGLEVTLGLVNPVRKDVAATGLDLPAGLSAVKLTGPDGRSLALAQEGLLVSTGPGRAFRPMESGEMLPGQGIWLLGNNGPLPALQVRKAGAGAWTSLAFDAASGPQAVDLEVPEGFCVLLEAGSTSLPPALALVPGDGRGTPSRWDWAIPSVSGSRSSFVLPPGRWTLHAKDPRGDAGEGAFPVDVSVRSFPVDSASGNDIPPGTATLRTLDRGGWELGLGMGLLGGMTAREPMATLDARRSGASAHMEAPGSVRVALVNTGIRNGRFALDRGSASVASGTAGSAEMTCQPGQEVHADLQAPPDQRFWILGARDAPVFRDSATGIIREARLLELDWARVWEMPAGTGTLTCTASGGLVRVWSALPENRDRSFFGDVRTPSRNLEAGVQGVDAGGTTFRLDLKETALVSLGLDQGGILELSDRRGTVTAIAAGTDSPGMLRNLEAGTWTVRVRPVAGQSRPGALRLDRPEVLVARGEGAQEERFIRTGETCVVRMDFREASMAGITVRSRTEELDCELLDGNFRSLGTGRVYFPSLEAGTCWLVVRNPGEPQAWTAFVYGLEGNRTGVPDDVRALYRKGE